MSLAKLRSIVIPVLTWLVLANGQNTLARSVEVPRDYPTIKIAIDSVAPGDTIVLDSGTFSTGIITLHEGYTITSKYGPRHTVVYGGLSIPDEYYYYDHPLFVSGITFSGESTGIRHGYAAGICVKNCIFRQCWYAIVSEGGYFTGGTVDSCIFEDNWLGLDLKWETYMTVRYCVFRRNDIAISLYMTCDPVVSDNIIVSCSTGFVFDDACCDTRRNVIWKCNVGIDYRSHAPYGWDPEVSNSDFSNNIRSFVGNESLVGKFGNIDAVPLFCDSTLDDLTVSSASPLLAANNPGHVDIGGHAGVGCYNGDVDVSGGVDIADITTLISYLYLNGQPPNPLSAGEIDCQSPIDIGDLTYLISYLYLSGPIPYCR